MSLLAWLVLPVYAMRSFERQGVRGSPEGNRHSPLVAAGQHRQMVLKPVRTHPLQSHKRRVGPNWLRKGNGGGFDIILIQSSHIPTEIPDAATRLRDDGGLNQH